MIYTNWLELILYGCYFMIYLLLNVVSFHRWTLLLLKLVLGGQRTQQMWYLSSMNLLIWLICFHTVDFVIIMQIKEPVVCGITSLGMDHMETLGASSSEIIFCLLSFFLPVFHLVAFYNAFLRWYWIDSSFCFWLGFLHIT